VFDPLIDDKPAVIAANAIAFLIISVLLSSRFVSYHSSTSISARINRELMLGAGDSLDKLIISIFMIDILDRSIPVIRDSLGTKRE
jgi:hypothetical protein